MPKFTRAPLGFLVAACFGVLVAACERGDISLGKLGGAAAGETSGVAGAVAGQSSSIAGDGGLLGAQAGNAAVGGKGGAGVSGAGAPAPAPAGASGVVAGGPAPNSVARPSAGCGQDAVRSDSSIVVSGTRANYSLELPTGYDKTRAYPLVLAFRSMSTTVEQFRQELKLASVASAVAIVVYPNPLNETAAWEYTRDMPLVERLLTKLKAGNCIDEDRVFALGAGAGSLFVNLVGCVLADQVRAIAPLEGAPPPPGPCMGKTAVWLVQAGADSSLQGATLGNRDYWVGRNSCDLRMSTPVAPAGCVEYAGCDVGFPVRFCEHESQNLPSFAASGAWSFFEAL